jgi:hypothetical protein
MHVENAEAGIAGKGERRVCRVALQADSESQTLRISGFAQAVLDGRYKLRIAV